MQHVRVLVEDAEVKVLRAHNKLHVSFAHISHRGRDSREDSKGLAHLLLTVDVQDRRHGQGRDVVARDLPPQQCC